MAVFELFSKRQKALRGDIPEVYTYEDLPNRLKVQIIHIWSDTLGNDHEYNSDSSHGANVRRAYKFIVDALCREYGHFRLPSADKYGQRHYSNELANYLLQVDDIERQLDIVELSFRYIDKMTRKYNYLDRQNPSERVDNAISELNIRFKENGVGYSFIEGEIIRIDSEFLHSEVVKPALKLLNEKVYSGAQQEFLCAYEHYLHGRNKEALNECLKSFESTMKSICENT